MRTLTFYAVLILTLQACSHTAIVAERDSHEPDESTKYSAIFYIHADADYLYHDANRAAVRANERALSSALEIAEEAQSGEIFIIHQKRKRSFLGIIPRRNNDIYYFRNGTLQQQIKYRYQGASVPFLQKEGEIYHQLTAGRPANREQSYFFFFGHEIPVSGGEGYHNSHSDVNVNASALVSGLNAFVHDEDDKFGLITLSTCSNGTPLIAEQLLPLTNYLLASSQNLHLSYLDVEGLLLLQKDPSTTPHQIARVIAKQSFDRLTKDIQTEVALSVYDMSEVSLYLSELAEIVRNDEETTRPNIFRENVDCAELEQFDATVFTQGVETWYRPPRFGRRASSGIHSGWGCKID